MADILRLGRLPGVVIMDAPSLIQAGLKAAKAWMGGATFPEGHELGADLLARVPLKQIGRCWLGSKRPNLVGLVATVRAPDTLRHRQSLVE